MKQRQLIENTREIIEKGKRVGLESSLLFEEPLGIYVENPQGGNCPIDQIVKLVKIHSGTYCWKNNKRSTPYKTTIFLGEIESDFEFGISKTKEEMSKKHLEAIQYIKEAYFLKQ